MQAVQNRAFSDFSNRTCGPVFNYCDGDFLVDKFSVSVLSGLVRKKLLSLDWVEINNRSVVKL